MTNHELARAIVEDLESANGRDMTAAQMAYFIARTEAILDEHRNQVEAPASEEN